MKQRPLKLNPDGSLKLDERDVTYQILDYLRVYGWQCMRTPATRVRYPSGKWGWIFEPAHPDYVCVRALISPAQRGRCDFFYMELKAPNARTKKKHAANQEEFVRIKTLQGYLCYRAPDKTDDLLQHFTAWYWSHFNR